MSPADRFHTIVTTVENKPGVLARVAGLFARRGFNIESLAVAPTDDERFSRITFTVDVESAPRTGREAAQQADQRGRDPRAAAAASVSRELMLVTVSADSAHRKELMELIDEWRAFVLAENNEQIMLSFSARTARLDEFEECLRPFGIAEIQRTGRVALPALD
ncbi:MAG: acetolactate synthase small subunit [Acidimicrobiales bacterium]